MLAVNGHAKHRQSLCRVGYGKTALSMDLFFITTANILSTHTFLLLSPKEFQRNLGLFFVFYDCPIFSYPIFYSPLEKVYVFCSEMITFVFKASF